MWKTIEKLFFVQTKEGGRKPGPLVYIGTALLVIIPSVLYMTSEGPGRPSAKKAQTSEEETPSDWQTDETAITASTEIPNTLYQEQEREKQIAEEQASGLRPDEIKARKEAIDKKYQEKADQSRSSSAQINFSDRIQQFQRPKATPTPAPAPTEAKPAQQGYMTFAERMAAEKKTAKSGNQTGNVVVFKDGPTTPPSTLTKPGDVINVATGTTPKPISNILPMGTFIPAVLDQDVLSTNLQAHVWVTLPQDVTFRRQLQLPLGLVKMRGTVAREPVQNLLDIVFDVMLFSDGTELPIQGFAYSAFDIRYPDRFRVRGIPGKEVVPPMYIKLQSLVYSAALGASDAYIQNYINENTQTDSTFTTVPQIDPVTGQTTTVLQQTQGNPVNNQIGATIGLSAGQAALESLVEDVQKDLDKYRPYVKLEKGTALFVQLDSTVDIASRKINGFAIAAAAEQAARRQGDPSARAGEPDVFPPGDARHRYDGKAQTPSILNPMMPAVTAGNGPNISPNMPNAEMERQQYLNTLNMRNDPQIQAAQQQAQQQQMLQVQQMLQTMKQQNQNLNTP